MKVFASILSALVLFLSTQCMIAGANLAIKGIEKKTTCCAKKKTCSKPSKPSRQTCGKKQNKEQEKGCQDACNPFMACCGCLYDCSLKSEFLINKLFAASVKNGYKNIYFPSTFTAGVWQPPELVG